MVSRNAASIAYQSEFVARAQTCPYLILSPAESSSNLDPSYRYNASSGDEKRPQKKTKNKDSIFS